MKIKKIKKYYCLVILIIIGILILIYNNIEQKKLELLEEKTTEDYNIVKSEIVINGKKFFDLDLVQNISIEPHVDVITGKKYITYEDFGAEAKEGFDDYNVIKETHKFANENRI